MLAGSFLDPTLGGLDQTTMSLFTTAFEPPSPRLAPAEDDTADNSAKNSLASGPAVADSAVDLSSDDENDKDLAGLMQNIGLYPKIGTYTPLK